MAPCAGTSTVSSIFFILLVFLNNLIFCVNGDDEDERLLYLKSKLTEIGQGIRGMPFVPATMLMAIGAVIMLLNFFTYPTVARSIKIRGNCRRNGGLFLDAALSNRACDQRLRLYKLDEIQMATSNFSPRRIINENITQGTATYKSKLEDGSEVVVERALKVRKGHAQRLIKDLTILYNKTHPNIAPLYGVCLEAEQPLLMYQLITSGEYLFNFIQNRRNKSWDQSVNVLKSIADALNHLHSYDLFHGNINGGNIIIDKKKSVWMTDLGLANFQIEKKKYTKRRDVYNFGLIVAQTLRGEICDSDDLFVRRFMSRVETRSEDIFFSKMEPWEDKTALWKVAVTACACLRQTPKKRPPMDVVAAVLVKGEEIPNKYQMIIEHVPPIHAVSIDSSPRHSGSIRGSTYRRSISQISMDEVPIIMGKDLV